MPRNSNIDLPKSEWVQISQAAVSAITVQNISFGTIILCGGNSAPVGDAGIRLEPGEALDAGTPLANIFPGVGTSMNVYARSAGNYGKVFVSHA